MRPPDRVRAARRPSLTILLILATGLLSLCAYAAGLPFTGPVVSAALQLQPEASAATNSEVLARPDSPAALPTPTALSRPSAPPVVNLSTAPPPPDSLRPPWVVTARETGLWSGPVAGSLYNQVPGGTVLRVLDRQDSRFRVFYPGDRAQRAPGEAWVDLPDLQGVAWPRWVRLRAPGVLQTLPSSSAPSLHALKTGEYVEVIGDARGDWAQVFYLGDGRVAPLEGWLAVGPTAPIPGPDVVSTFALGRDLLKGTAEPWIKLPYRSQMDGSAYALANCGPTTIGMVLEGFGFSVPAALLRREVLSLQPSEDCDDCGVYIQNLAEVVSRRGLKVGGLRDDNPDTFHRWTMDEVRTELAAGRPVVPQVYYRKLPGRASSAYYGDHFIVLTGVLGDRFVFNDPIDVEGPGYSRLISPQLLDQAMAGADYPYAAFSVGRVTN